jgi:hypothetical protein
VSELRSGFQESPLHIFVQGDVGSSESVDRLLRITNNEKLTANGATPSPVGFGSVIRSEKK